MRVFDFDNTIYNGESVFDFFLFSIKYNPAVVKYVPVVTYNLLKYKLGKTTLEDLEKGFKKYAYKYMSSFENPEKLVEDFWDKHFKNIKSWYVPQRDDVIVTGSFDVIMDEVCKRLGVENCVCSKIDRESMTVTYINFNHNKLSTFRSVYGEDVVIDELYTDCDFDKPLMEISKSAYLVKGNKITKIK